MTRIPSLGVPGSEEAAPVRENASASDSDAPVLETPSGNWLAVYVGNLRRISTPARWFLLGSMLVGMAWATFMLLFNLYMKERGFGEGVIGRVLSFQSFGMVAMAIPAAALVTRRSARALLIISSICVAGGFVAQTLADAVPALLLASGATGGFLAISRVVGAPFLMNHSSQAERTHVFSLSFAAMLGSGLITHFAAGSLHKLLTGVSGSSLTAYRWVLLLGCACALLGAVAFSRVPTGIVGQRSQRLPFREFWHTKGRLLFKLTFPFFLVGMGAGLIIPFLNLYFRDRFGLSPQTIGVYYGLVQASMILGVLIGPELARRFGMIKTVVFSEWASIPFMVILAFTGDLPMATMAFFLRGALMNLGVPIANNYMMERVGMTDRALVNSWSMIAWSLSWAVTAAIGGLMIEHGGYTLPLLLASGLYVASSALYFAFFHRCEIYAGRPAIADDVRPCQE
jgi:predicted MFS family arabinose efflux permease